MLTKFECVAAVLALISAPCLGQGTISHIVVIIKENRSFDHMFGACASSAGGPIAALTGFPSSPPTGSCNTTLATCPTGTISLFHANPALPDGYNSDLPHTRQAIFDSIDSGAMDGFGGVCSPIPSTGSPAQCWWRNICSAGTYCTLAGSQGAAGGYTYFGCSDLPFYDQMIQAYGIADHYFPYGTPSYPDHLQMIAPGGSSGLGEASDNPYTPGYSSSPGQWTCDANTVAGSQPSGCATTAPYACSGGYTYGSQVLSQALTSENILGTSLTSAHYYQAGLLTSNQTACVCDEGTTLSTTSTSGGLSVLPNTGPNGTGSGTFCPVTCTGSATCTGGGTDYCVVSTVSIYNPTPSVGNNPGSLCPNITTVLDLADSHLPAVTWRWYGPTLQAAGYYWNSPAYIEHIRYGNDWTKDVVDWTQFDRDVAAGTLPQVSWLVAPMNVSEHPYPGNNIAQGMDWTAARVQKIFQSPLYQSTAIFITWDDPGGFYDHVAVPSGDAAGYAPRAPLICIGPYCANRVTSTPYEPGSIVRCIEDTFRLPHTLGKDATATSVCPSDNSGMINLALTSPIPPPRIAPRQVFFAEQRREKPEPDLVTLVRSAWRRLHHRGQDENETLAAIPQLNREHCFEGTHLHEASYVTKKGSFMVEVCGSDDGKQIYWPGQNPMDADDADEGKKH